MQLLSGIKSHVEIEGQKRIPWTHVAQRMRGRDNKQCRERWVNHLRPEIKKGEWTEEEDNTLFALHEVVGNRYVRTSSIFGSRSRSNLASIPFSGGTKLLDHFVTVPKTMSKVDSIL